VDFFPKKLENIVEFALGKKYFPIFLPKRMTKLVEKKALLLALLPLMLVNLYFIGQISLPINKFGIFIMPKSETKNKLKNH